MRQFTIFSQLEMLHVAERTPVDRSKLIQQLIIVLLDDEEREDYLDRLRTLVRGQTPPRTFLKTSEICTLMDKGMRSASDELLLEIAGTPSMIHQIILHLGVPCERDWICSVAKLLA